MTSASPSSSKKAKKVAARELDVSNATRGVWLVKVPNYVADSWKDAQPDAELGRVTVASGSKVPEMRFILSEDLARKTGAKMDLEIPRVHLMHTQDTTKQHLNAFSETSTKQLEAEGKVTQRADLRPLDSAAYMNLKQHQIKEAGRTKFNPVVKLDHTPVAKPVKEIKVPKQLDKRARADREMVLDLIFTLFKSHEFYTFKDLVHKTSQPPTYLREILKDACVYNTRAPHKNMWRLKDEYRHYQKQKTE